MKYFVSLLSGLLLLHAPLRTTLMVECVRSDGLSNVEIAGQDPCRIPKGTSHFLIAQNSGLRLLSGLSENESPCTDLLLDNASYEIVSRCSGILLHDLLYELARSPIAGFDADINHDFGHAGKSPPLTYRDRSLQLSLRI